LNTATISGMTFGRDFNAEQRAVFDAMKNETKVVKAQPSSRLDSKGYTPKAPKAAPALNQKVASGMNKSLGKAISQGQSLQSKFGSNKPTPTRYGGRYGL
jgi:hypothetical protein